jgi:hypothetical protein
MRARRQQNAQACASVLQANRAHTGVGLIGSWNVRFSRNDRRFRHITRARDRRDVPRNAAKFVRRRPFMPRPRLRIAENAHTSARRAHPIGYDGLFQIDCSALLLQPVPEKVVASARMSRMRSNRRLSASECNGSVSQEVRIPPPRLRVLAQFRFQMQKFESFRPPASAQEGRDAVRAPEDSPPLRAHALARPLRRTR